MGTREVITGALATVLDEVARLALGGAPDPLRKREAQRALATVRGALDAIGRTYLSDD